MSMKEVDIKLWDSHLHKTESTTYPYHQRDGRDKENGPTRSLPNDSSPPNKSSLLNDSGHTSIDKNASIDNVDLRPTDVIKRGTTGVDSSYFR
jgi:hypothetical protein